MPGRPYVDGEPLGRPDVIKGEAEMTTLKLLSTGLIAAAVLGGPVMAREHHSVMRQPAMTTDTAAPDAPFYQQGGRVCVPAPRVGAFATAPWTGNNVPCEPGTGSF
jgi:hypothetical protein